MLQGEAWEDLQMFLGLGGRRLYEFDGTVNKLSGQPVDRLDASNLLLRGSTLRNTEWVLALVVAAGTDTKIFRNRSEAPRKVRFTTPSYHLPLSAMQLVLSCSGSSAQLSKSCVFQDPCTTPSLSARDFSTY